jgi:hypothetical protein
MLITVHSAFSAIKTIRNSEEKYSYRQKNIIENRRTVLELGFHYMGLLGIHGPHGPSHIGLHYTYSNTPPQSKLPAQLSL